MTKAQFGAIRGDAGEVLVSAGKAGIISRWRIEPTGSKPDGSPVLRFKCQFSWVQDTLMGLRAINGKAITKRVRIKMRTKYGLEDVDIVGWDDWRYEGGVLYLENIVHAEGVRERTVSAPTTIKRFDR